MRERGEKAEVELADGKALKDALSRLGLLPSQSACGFMLDVETFVAVADSAITTLCAERDQLRERVEKAEGGNAKWENKWQEAYASVETPSIRKLAEISVLSSVTPVKVPLETLTAATFEMSALVSQLSVLRARAEKAEAERDAKQECLTCDAVHEILWHADRRGTGVTLATATVTALNAAVAERDRLRALIQAVADAQRECVRAECGNAGRPDLYEKMNEADAVLEATISMCIEEAKKWEK